MWLLACFAGTRSAYKILVRSPKGRGLVEAVGVDGGSNVKVDLKEIVCKVVH